MACTPSELLALTACCDTYSQHALLRLIVGARCQTLQLIDPMAACDFNTWLQDTSFLKGKSIHDLLRIIVGVECAVLNAGGLGGDSCILCGTVDPVAAPSCDCALYYKRTVDGNGEFWYWDADTLAWVKFLGGPA
jgi:hypothetical protein